MKFQQSILQGMPMLKIRYKFMIDEIIQIVYTQYSEDKYFFFENVFLKFLDNFT